MQVAGTWGCTASPVAAQQQAEIQSLCAWRGSSGVGGRGCIPHVPLGDLQSIPSSPLTCSKPSAGSWQRLSSSEMRAASCVLCWPSLAAPSRRRGRTSSSSSSSFCSSCCSSSANRRRSLSNSPSTFCLWLSTIFCRAQEGQLREKPDARSGTDPLECSHPKSTTLGWS